MNSAASPLGIHVSENTRAPLPPPSSRSPSADIFHNSRPRGIRAPINLATTSKIAPESKKRELIRNNGGKLSSAIRMAR